MWEAGSSVTCYEGIFSKHRLDQVISCLKFILVSDSPPFLDCSTQGLSLVPAHFSSLVPGLMNL